MTDTLFPARLPGTSVVGILSTTNNIDLTTTATTALYTPSNNSVIITAIIIRPTTISGFVSAAVIGIGQNGSVNDIVPAATLTNLTSTSVYFFIAPPSGATPAKTPSGTVINLKVATPGVSTTFLASVDLIGYLV